VLDKGQEEDWFGSGWICWGAAISVLSLVGFVWREMACHEPIVQLRILRNRNFGIGTITNTLYGFTFYGVIAILPLFLQTLLGYSALNSGLASSPRGVGSLLSMLLVAMLVIRIDCRILLCFGFALFGYSTLLFSHMNLDIAMSSVVLPNFVNGFASGFIFVPLTTMTMSTLKKQQIGNASGIYNLMRNIGGSIGIAGITALLERGAQHHQNFLAANMTAGNAQTITMTTGLAAHFRAVGASAASAQEMALGIIYRNMVKQSSLLAYTNDFALLGLMAMFCVLPVLFLRRVQHNK